MDNTTTKKPAPAKAAGIVAPAADWEKIELDYRAGIRTLRQIASENGISEGAIRKRAKRDDWTRDLSERIQEKAEQLVRKEAVRSLVRTESAVTERVLVEVNAQAVADVRLAHRSDIHRARRLTNSLLDELEKQTDPDTLVMLEELGELLRREDDKGIDKKNDLYNKVLSLGERSKTMKTLAESLQKLVDMERTAFGMDKEVEKKDDPLTALLHAISTVNASGFAPRPIDPEKHKASTQSAFKPVQRPDEETDSYGRV